MSIRDRSLEKRVLSHAERAASGDAAGYVAAVEERLDRFGRENGDSFDDRPISELLGELAEEALDLGGWGVLALQALELNELPPASRERLAASLDALATLGAEAYAITRRARSTVLALPELDRETHR